MRDFSPPTAPPSRTAHSTSFLLLLRPLSLLGPLHPSLFARNGCWSRSIPSLSFSFPSSCSCTSTPVASTRGPLLLFVPFRPSVANIRNVCGGHATGHQLHDLRFADLASSGHTQGCALVQRTASRVHTHARDTQRARHRFREMIFNNRPNAGEMRKMHRFVSR